MPFLRLLALLFAAVSVTRAGDDEQMHKKPCVTHVDCGKEMLCAKSGDSPLYCLRREIYQFLLDRCVMYEDCRFVERCEDVRQRNGTDATYCYYLHTMIKPNVRRVLDVRSQ